VSEKKIYKYELKLTKSQRSKLEAAQKEMFYQNRTSPPGKFPGILFLQVTDSLEFAFGYFIPHKIADEVSTILSDWLKWEKGGA